MSEPSLPTFYLFVGALLAVCLGSEHQIRHHRVNQRKSNPDSVGLYDKSTSTLDSNDLWQPTTNQSPGRISKLWTNYHKTEMKSVQNLFIKTLPSDVTRDAVKTNQKRDSDNPKPIGAKDKTGVSIKFSGKKYHLNNPNPYTHVKNVHRDYMNSLQFTKPNKTSLWPLTYSPGTVEATLNNTRINITSESGNAVFLPCRVGHLGDTQISWIRRRDWHVITSGDNRYSNDHRFSVLHDTASHDWTLHIRYVTNADKGTYECQVSTDTGILSLFVNLSVIVPEATIVGQTQYHINKGSSISLTCIVHNNLIVPAHVLWHHNGELLNFLRERSDVKISSEKPEVKQKIKDSFVSGTNFSQENNIYDVKSHLRIDSALDLHSGNYSCSTPNAEPYYIVVFITEGDKTAAVQRIDSGSKFSNNMIGNFLIFLLLSSLNVLR